MKIVKVFEQGHEIASLSFSSNGFVLNDYQKYTGRFLIEGYDLNKKRVVVEIMGKPTIIITNEEGIHD